MALAKDEPSCSAIQVIDLVSAVKELHGLNSQELGKLLKETENFTIQYGAQESPQKIDVEKLAGHLPLHIIAVLVSSEKDETLFRYLFCGIRLLHSLCDLAPRNPKLEQILLDDVKVSGQLLDLVFYILIVCGGYEQKNNNYGMVPLMHPALVACSLHLLNVCISSYWQDLVQVLLAHPKVDIFMDAAFGAVCVSIKFLKMQLSSQHKSPEHIIHSLCQQCEASLQFLQLLCQQKLFRERLLRNKDLCGNGGVLFLAQATLKLDVVPHFEASTRIVATISRLKAKLLSILLNLCEAESISYLDEVASSPCSLDLAKSVALEIIQLLKDCLDKDPRCFTPCSDRNYPMGLSQLNAMRLADILSDDSNFRSYITVHFTKVLTAIFSLPHKDFLSSWCSSKLPLKEEDGTIEYDSFATAGWVLDVVSSSELKSSQSLEFTVTPKIMTQASYLHQRTSLFVKIIANLHCFIPTICEEQERNLFVNKFMACLQTDPSNSMPAFTSLASDTLKAATINRNLCSLLMHAESLIPHFLNEEDVQLLRVFSKKFESLINPTEEKKPEDLKYWDKFAKLNISEHHQVDDVMREGRSTSNRNAAGRFTAVDRDTHNVETSGSDTSSTRGKHAGDPMENNEFPKSTAHIEEDERIEPSQYEEKQRRKRKRTIMNDQQVAFVERALLDEPDMQRNSSSLQSWADKLSLHGSEVTPSQLKNWLNNRKARLARTGKDVRAAPDNNSALRGLRSNNSPESPGRDASAQPNAKSDAQVKVNNFTFQMSGTECVPCKQGDYVLLKFSHGEEVGIGKVFQSSGMWFGRNLEELRAYVVDITELKIRRSVRLPYPSMATGGTFEEAEAKIGKMRVLWESNSSFVLPPIQSRLC